MAGRLISNKKDFNRVEIEHESGNDFIDMYLTLIRYRYKEGFDLAPKQVVFMRELIKFQKRFGTVNSKEKHDAFRKSLLDRKIVPNTTTFSTHKSTLKSAGWINSTYEKDPPPKDPTMQVASGLIEGISKGYVVLSTKVKGKGYKNLDIRFEEKKKELAAVAE